MYSTRNRYTYVTYKYYFAPRAYEWGGKKQNISRTNGRSKSVTIIITTACFCLLPSVEVCAAGEPSVSCRVSRGQKLHARTHVLSPRAYARKSFRLPETFFQNVQISRFCRLFSRLTPRVATKYHGTSRCVEPRVLERIIKRTSHCKIFS